MLEPFAGSDGRVGIPWQSQLCEPNGDSGHTTAYRFCPWRLRGGVMGLSVRRGPNPFGGFARALRLSIIRPVVSSIDLLSLTAARMFSETLAKQT
jgi:hypothetical protein